LAVVLPRGELCEVDAEVERRGAEARECGGSDRGGFGFEDFVRPVKECDEGDYGLRRCCPLVISLQVDVELAAAAEDARDAGCRFSFSCRIDLLMAKDLVYS